MHTRIRIALLLTMHLTVAGCGNDVVVTTQTQHELILSLRQQGGYEELVADLSGETAGGTDRAKRLAWETFFGDWRSSDRLLVFADPAGVWPGLNPATIVYLGGDGRIRAWKTRSEEPVFVMAHLRMREGAPYELRLFSRNRWGGGTHIDDYRITESEITRTRAEVHTDLDLGRIERY